MVFLRARRARLVGVGHPLREILADCFLMLARSALLQKSAAYNF